MPFPLSLSITGFSPSGIADEAFDPDGSRAAALGKLVARDTGTIAQQSGGDQTLFTVATGPILLVGIWGYVTTVIQTQADSIKLIANQTVTGTSVDMCTALNISAKAVGTILTIDGTVGNAMVALLNAMKWQALSQIILPGTIDLNATADNSGAIQWSAIYLPLANGATMVAA